MSTSLPTGYIEIDRWDLERVPSWQVITVLVLSLVALLVTVNVALGVQYLAQGEAGLRLSPPALLLGVVLGLSLHEGAHAVAFLALGGSPRLGRKGRTRLGPVLYVSAPGCYFGRGGYLFAGLGSVAILTVLLLAVVAVVSPGSMISATAIFAVSLNIAGAGGDAIITRAVFSAPPDARFEDTGDGFIVYGPRQSGGSA